VIDNISYATKAQKLLSSVKLMPLKEITQIKGGKNNKVFDLVLEDQTELILKVYHKNSNDKRDRLSAEWNFLNYAIERGIKEVARPIACDQQEGLAVFTKLPGCKRVAEKIKKSDIELAADFIISLNVMPRNIQNIREASEACFSISDHLASVNKRIDQLEALDPSAPYYDRAKKLVSTRLKLMWSRILSNSFGKKTPTLFLENTLPWSQKIISPSDFGFHNILVSKNKLAFLDFEYAGIDDPAKLVCDFYLAPEIRCPIDTFHFFLEKLSIGLNLGDEFIERSTYLLPIYQIKWICIVLNDFLLDAEIRRSFATSEDRSLRCLNQLEKATKMFDQIKIRNKGK
jgi:thiamine kinase-like enzyme